MTWIFADFDFFLDAPLLAKVATSDPNAVESASFLPGSMIRGSVASSLLARGISAESEEFYKLILNGSVRYLNCYPVISDQRSLPIPRSWMIEKGTALDQSTAIFDLAIENSAPDAPLRNPPFSFAARCGDEWAWSHSSRTIRTHIARDRNKGKAWTQVDGNMEIAHGALFSYESMSARQTLRGIIQLRSNDQTSLGELEKHLCGSLTLGRSRRSGYGLVCCKRHQSDQEATRTSEYTPCSMSVSISANQYFRVVFLSDCIVRNPMTGQIDSDVLCSLIFDIFDSNVEIVRDRVFLAAGFVGGYNAKWGLPLQQNQTVAAGSLIVLRAKADIPREKISQIETDGIGERLTEGFGRLIVEPLPTKQPTVRQFVIPFTFLRPKSVPPKIVMAIQERILRQKLVQAIEALAAREVAFATGIPPNSLIGRLRFPLRRGLGGLEQMRIWLGDGPGQLRKQALRHLTKCRMGEKRISLDLWLLDRLNADDEMLSSAIADTASRFFVIDRESAKNLLSSRAGESAQALIDMALGFLSKVGYSPDGRILDEPQEVVQ